MEAQARRAVLYPDAYAWYILASALDIMVTHTILHHFDGWEVNVLAARLVERFGHWGLIGLKFCSVILVVMVCETVGRQRPNLGKVLAVLSIVVGGLPVVIGLLQLVVWVGGGPA
jgi:uncharacterized membrane protein